MGIRVCQFSTFVISPHRAVLLRFSYVLTETQGANHMLSFPETLVMCSALGSSALAVRFPITSHRPYPFRLIHTVVTTLFLVDCHHVDKKAIVFIVYVVARLSKRKNNKTFGVTGDSSVVTVSLSLNHKLDMLIHIT